MGKSPEIVKIRLKPSDSVDGIFSFIKKAEAAKIIFICPRVFPDLADVSVLKDLKLVIDGFGGEVIFVIVQKWIRERVQSHGVSAYTKCPSEYSRVDTNTFADFSKKVVASKNKTSLAKKVKKMTYPKKKELLPPEFSMQPISGTGRQEKSMRGLFFFAFLGLILLLGAVLLWISPRAKIIIKPKVSVLPVTQNIIVKLSEVAVPGDEQVVPSVRGIYVQTEVHGKETFPSTEKTYDLTNARGMITLFNETSKPKYLVPSRLSTDEGIIFRFTKEVMIPPRQDDRPGMLQVEVVADEYDGRELPIGERGNLGAGNELFFPALRPDLRELYYGKTNLGPLVGGSTLTHYFINEKDFEAAREILEEIFRTRAVEKLRNELIGRSDREDKKYVLLDRPEVIIAEVTDVFFPENLVGTESQTFQASVALKLSGLVFDQSEVVDLMVEKAKLVQDHRKKLIYMDENSVQYSVLTSEKLLDEKWLKLSVSIMGVETLDFNSSGEFAQKWHNEIKRELVGKPLGQINRILTNYPEIEDVLEVKVSPFWAKKLPNIFDQIRLEVVEGYE